MVHSNVLPSHGLLSAFFPLFADLNKLMIIIAKPAIMIKAPKDDNIFGDEVDDPDDASDFFNLDEV